MMTDCPPRCESAKVRTVSWTYEVVEEYISVAYKRGEDRSPECIVDRRQGVSSGVPISAQILIKICLYSSTDQASQHDLGDYYKLYS
jgi:hypothetical protein